MYICKYIYIYIYYSEVIVENFKIVFMIKIRLNELHVHSERGLYHVASP